MHNYMHDLVKVSIDCILFDLDGTLIDSERSAMDAIRSCFQAWGIMLASDDVASITGVTWDSALRLLLSKHSLPVSYEKAKEQILSTYRLKLKSELNFIPGALEFLQDLHQRKFPFGLVSGSSRGDILSALDKMGVRSFFQCVLGSEDYPESKPHPGGYLKALSFMSFKPESCLVFEDSYSGIRSARLAGAWVVAVLEANRTQQDTSAAHFWIQNFKGLQLEWVQNLDFSKC